MYELLVVVVVVTVVVVVARKETYIRITHKYIDNNQQTPCDENDNSCDDTTENDQACSRQNNQIPCPKSCFATMISVSSVRLDHSETKNYLNLRASSFTTCKLSSDWLDAEWRCSKESVSSNYIVNQAMVSTIDMILKIYFKRRNHLRRNATGSLTWEKLSELTLTDFSYSWWTGNRWNFSYHFEWSVERNRFALFTKLKKWMLKFACDPFLLFEKEVKDSRTIEFDEIAVDQCRHFTDFTC